ncbi:MAG: thymidine phosphorylase, partial [Candidatus Sumerlaeales bacterium]|nr:thymidine phosphorylase [Candidatus Sumerlaeales bacterium]
MRAVDLIERKRQGGELTPDEIKWFVTGFLSGEVEVYQVTAWLMAVYFQGLTPQETSALASAMAYSGETYNWDGLFDARVVDKHSSGGVGDKVSLILAPLVAAMGMTDPMISGRGLGHTGGTLDKLESIPGFNVFPGRAQFERQLKEIGTVMCGQTDNFVPADKMLYSLRDVTATVPSVPLISASIISKKFAAGVQSLLLDVKAGSGAFMKTTADAEKLALALKHTGEGLGMEIRVLITDMNQPLGRMIGNSLEVAESIDVLHGVGPADL